MQHRVTVDATGLITGLLAREKLLAFMARRGYDRRGGAEHFFSSGGFLVATVPRVINERNTWGIIGLTISVVGLFTLGILSPLGLAASIAGMSRRPRGTAIAGVVLGLVGTILLIVYTLPRIIPPAVREVGMGARANDTIATRAAQDTWILMRDVADRLDAARPKNGDAPSQAEGDAAMSGRQDSWINVIRYARPDDETFEIRSAGPDRIFDTDDDIVITRTR